MMLNGLAYSATTDSSGNWSVTVPASAVGALGEAVCSDWRQRHRQRGQQRQYHRIR
ncbi:hypothetical protein O5707_07240 [Escherichia coli]|nr:hypothetical protein [Escherichia coli]